MLSVKTEHYPPSSESEFVFGCQRLTETNLLCFLCKRYEHKMLALCVVLTLCEGDRQPLMGGGREGGFLEDKLLHHFNNKH